MISISKAAQIISRETAGLGDERIALNDAIGRILAENVVSDSDLPPFDRSQMDGYAIVAGDTAQVPVRLKIVGESAAGHGWHKRMKRGEAVRIMTGAPVPLGADAVQRVELTREADGVVEIREKVKKGNSIVRQGAEIKKAKTILRKGIAITASNIAVLAAFGYARVKVAKQPRVAILGTGSEIVDVGERPKRDQIRNSNSIMLDVLCRQFGAGTKVLDAVGDDIQSLKATIAEAAGTRKSKIQNPKSDILIITGGVSVGKYDLTKDALLALGAEIFFERVNLKPGKPTVFARLGKTLVFGLPGNPVSAAVTFHLFVRPAILQMQNAAQTRLTPANAILAKDAKAAKDRDTYLASRLETNNIGQLLATPLRSQGSSDFIGFADADSLIFIPRGTTASAGQIVDIVIL